MRDNDTISDGIIGKKPKTITLKYYVLAEILSILRLVSRNI